MLNDLNGYFFLFSSRVAGVEHHDWKDNIHSLLDKKNKGLIFRLEADPANPYDSKAVKVLTEGDGEWLLGFLPREQLAQILANRIICDGEYTLFAKINDQAAAHNILIDIYQERKQ